MSLAAQSLWNMFLQLQVVALAGHACAGQMGHSEVVDFSVELLGNIGNTHVIKVN